jgi:hypothetical protein
MYGKRVICVGDVWCEIGVVKLDPSIGYHWPGAQSAYSIPNVGTIPPVESQFGSAFPLS